MLTRRTARNALVAALLGLSSVPALAGDKPRAEPPKPEWDDLSKQVIAKIAGVTEDFASVVRYVRKVSCTIDVHISMNVLPEPLEARLAYAWEDRNDSGTLTGDEIDIEVESVSAAALRPAMKELATALALQTVSSGASLFPLNDIRTVKVEGGYKMRLQPVGDEKVRSFLGYEVTYLTVSDDFRPTSVRSKDLAGGESLTTPTWTRWRDRWLPTGWPRVFRSGSTATETQRTDEFEESDGLPLLARVRIDESTTTLAGIVTSKHLYTLRDWKVERRTLPVTVPGVNTPKPDKDPDEELFRKPPAPAPAPVPGPAPEPAPAPAPAPAPTPERTPAPAPAPAPDTPARPPPARSALGTWKGEDEYAVEELTLCFLADGTATLARTFLGETVTDRGTYTGIEQGELELTSAESGDVATFAFKLADAKTLVLTKRDGGRWTFARAGAAPAPAPAPAPPPDGPARKEPQPTIVGVWHAGDARSTLRIELRPDGAFERELRTGERTEKLAGTYVLRDDVLEARTPGKDEPVLLRVRLVDADTLELRDEKGGSIRLTRGEP